MSVYRTLTGCSHTARAASSPHCLSSRRSDCTAGCCAGFSALLVHYFHSNSGLTCLHTLGSLGKSRTVTVRPSPSGQPRGGCLSRFAEQVWGARARAIASATVRILDGNKSGWFGHMSSVATDGNMAYKPVLCFPQLTRS